MKENSSFVSLLSSGLDSPIATYLMMKKGFDCYSVSFLHNYEESLLNEEKIIQLGKKLVSHTNQKMILQLVDYDPILEIFQNRCKDRIRCILCKRTMLDIAFIVCGLRKSNFIVTGDILGEQASQTIQNLNTINSAIKKIPIIRPLIGFNKLDIIKLSQKLDLYNISLMEENSCNFNPKFPETRSKIYDIKKEEEEKLDREDIRKIIFENSKIIKITN